ncbi:MAG: hypothetical protein U9O63_04595 [Actinomycetota bacterium]|nr:hypothetical protein [Actinomycetota bacterium]
MTNPSSRPRANLVAVLGVVLVVLGGAFAAVEGAEAEAVGAPAIL